MSGRPLADAHWLADHHRAKLPERRLFAQRLAQLRPRSVLDLGCGPGLWLDLLDEVLPPECAFVGVDSDEAALDHARERARGWGRHATFMALDLEDVADALPVADLTLCFNVFPYLPNPLDLLNGIAARGDGSAVAVRQYDGDALRFGPMATSDRARIEAALRSSVALSGQFRHYDLDRTFAALHASGFDRREVGFELFQRSTPFPGATRAYIEGTYDWTLEHLSIDAADLLEGWRATTWAADRPSYFIEVDLVAVLS